MYMRGLRPPRIGFTLGDAFDLSTIAPPPDIAPPIDLSMPWPGIVSNAYPSLAVPVIDAGPQFDLSTIAPLSDIAPPIDFSMPSPYGTEFYDPSLAVPSIEPTPFNVPTLVPSPPPPATQQAASKDLSAATQLIKSATSLAEAAAGSGAGSRSGTVQPTGPGSAPRVNVPSAAATDTSAFKSIEKALTAESIKGIPNWLLGLGIIVGVKILSGGTSRNRQR
jgi:hypothetical protein